MGTLIRDGVKIGGTTVYVDSNLSTTSENPVENKIVTSALNEKADISSLSDVATTGSYNDLSNTPIIDNTLSTESTNAVQNKIITENLEDKYPIDYDVALSLAEWEALGEEKYYNHKNYYIYDAGVPTEKPIVYGWHVDPNESDPSSAITYLKNAVGMTPASMGTTTFNYGSWQDVFFMPKPCMVNENGEVDYYLDENDYTKKKDNVTITSSPVDELPLSFNSNDDGVINYHIYGTESGAGVETENLCPMIFSHSGVINDEGRIDVLSTRLWTNMIPVESNADYVLSITGTASNGENLVFNRVVNYDVNQNFISRTVLGTLDNQKTITTESNVAYIVLDIRTPSNNVDIQLEDVDTISVTKGSTAPTSYIPYGYQIPILCQTPNLFDYTAQDTSKGFEDNCYIKNDGTVTQTNDWYISEYMAITEGTKYMWRWYSNATSQIFSPSLVFYNSDKQMLSSADNIAYDNRSIFEFTAPNNAVYVRASILKAMQTITCLNQQSNYNLYIGNTKLSEEEYLDYAEQKVYKRTENLFNPDSKTVDVLGNEQIGVTLNSGPYRITNSSNLNVYYRVGSTATTDTPVAVGASIYLNATDTVYVWVYPASNMQVMVNAGSTEKPYVPYYQPIDPPISLPTINTYQGENTLSSTETLGKISIYAMSDITNLNYNGNAMMEWPLIFWKYEPGNIDGEGNFYVSNRKIDNTYNCWCNYNSKNNIINHFYTAIYNGGIYNGKLRSMSGYKLTDRVSTAYSNTSTYAIDDKVLYNSNMYICITAINTPEDFDNSKWVQIPINGITTGTQEVNAATANNTTSDVEWYIDVWADRMLINGLLILMGKSLNSQAIFGQGITSGGQTAKNNYTTGSLNDKGMFYGSVSGTTTAVKVFGMENWWGLSWHRTAGLLGTSTGYVYKMTYNNIDGSTATSYNSNGSGYLTLSTTRPSANNYVIKMKYGPFGYIPIDTTGGSSTTYYCDYYYGGNGYLLVGGSSDYGVYAGFSSFNLNYSFASADWHLGACLSLKPLAGL